MSRDTTARPLATGCLVLFALPFLVAGVVLIVRAIRTASGATAVGAVIAHALAGLAFTGVGTAVVVMGSAYRRAQAASATLRASHPEEPWLWEPQWASGRIDSGDRTRLAGAWALTLFWNAISSVSFLIVPAELRKGNTAALLALLFPLVGVGILLWAVRATIRWRKFGTSTLELERTPVPPGGELRARLVTRLDPPPETLRLVLTCVSRDHTSEGTSDTIVWLDEHDVRSDEMRRELDGAVVPVVFALPADAPQTERDVLRTSIHWKLHASARVAGVDYQSRFELPVFHPGNAGQEPAATLAKRRPRSPSIGIPDGRAAFDSTVRVDRTARGHEFYFGPGRNPGAATSFAVMAGILFAAAYGLSRVDIPTFIVIVCAAIALLLLFILLDVWLGTTRVEITSDEVVVRKSLLGIGTTRRIPRSDVGDVSLKIGMSQAETALQSPRAWYDIKLQRRSGRRVTLGSNIANKREAEWLVAQIRGALGMSN